MDLASYLPKNINTYTNYLSNDQNISKIGLIVGFVNTITLKKLRLRPLNTFFEATFNGIFYAYATSFVTGLFDKPIKSILPAILLSSMFYYKLTNSLKYKQPIKINCAYNQYIDEIIEE